MNVLRKFLVLEAREWFDDFIRSWRQIHATEGNIDDVAQEWGISKEAAAARATRLRKMSKDMSLELSKQQRAEYDLPKFARGPRVATSMQDRPQLELMPAEKMRPAPKLIDIIKTLNASSGYIDAARKLGINSSTLRGVATNLRNKGYPVKTFKRGRPQVAIGSITKRKFIDVWNSVGSPQLAAELLNAEGGNFTAKSASALATKLREKGFELQSFTHLRGPKHKAEQPTPDDILRDLEAEIQLDEPDDIENIDDEALDAELDADGVDDDDDDDDEEREIRKAMFGDLDDDDIESDDDELDDIDDELDDLDDLDDIDDEDELK